MSLDHGPEAGDDFGGLADHEEDEAGAQAQGEPHRPGLHGPSDHQFNRVQPGHIETGVAQDEGGHQTEDDPKSDLADNETSLLVFHTARQRARKYRLGQAGDKPGQCQEDHSAEETWCELKDGIEHDCLRIKNC